MAAKIAVEHRVMASDVASAIDAAERRVRAAVPTARLLCLELDMIATRSARRTNRDEH